MPDTNDDNPTLKRILSESVPKRPSSASPSPPPATVPDDDDDAITFAQMNGKYSTLRPENKTIPRLHVVDKTGKVRSFQYVHLDSDSNFDGGEFSVVFAGTKHWKLTVKGHGKMFWRVYDYISLHRWPYIREEARDFGNGKDDGETVFTSIEFTDVTPKERD
jgi:hypothetical protein